MQGFIFLFLKHIIEQNMVLEVSCHLLVPLLPVLQGVLDLRSYHEVHNPAIIVLHAPVNSVPLRQSHPQLVGKKIDTVGVR